MNIINVYDDIIIAIDTIPVNPKKTARQREQKAVKEMLRELVGNAKLNHDSNGKPIVEGYNVSISHTVYKTGGYAAVMLSKSHEVGVDIEYKSDRVMKIANRFLRNDEKPQTVDDNLIYWCAKEAVYKLFSSDDLTYQQMKVNDEKTEVLNLKRNSKAPISYFDEDDFILVYTFL